MADEVKETIQYECEADSIEELVKIFSRQLWGHRGRQTVRRGYKDLGWMMRLLPPGWFDRILAYGMATTVRIIIAEIMAGNLEFIRGTKEDLVDGKEAEAQSDGQVP